MKSKNGNFYLEKNTLWSSMGLLKNQEAWLSRGAIVAILMGSLFLFKYLLDSQPNLIPADVPIVEALSQQVLQQQQVSLSHSQSEYSQPDSQDLQPDLQDLQQDVQVNSELEVPRPLCQLRNCTNFVAPRSSPFPIDVPNSFLPCKDYVKPGASAYDLDIAKYFMVDVTDSEILHAAQEAATLPLAQGKPKIAFLFVIRQKIPFEPLWERFFAAADNDSYSIYTHASWWVDDFPTTSLFHNRSIPSKPVHRFDISLADVVRRLLAFALLDVDKANMWFVLVSEACIPVRSFPYVYDYLMNSTTSFVEAYSPLPWFRRWNPEPVFKMERLRKGELWMAMHRRHAGMVVGDVTFYRKFKGDCSVEGAICTLDEQYAQTLLHCLDPQGIANRSVTYADWSDPDHGGSPLMQTAELINTTLIEKIQNRTENLDGQYMDSTDDYDHTQQTCVYNGRPHSPCFLFARKFSAEEADVGALLDLPVSALGY